MVVCTWAVRHLFGRNQLELRFVLVLSFLLILLIFTIRLLSVLGLLDFFLVSDLLLLIVFLFATHLFKLISYIYISFWLLFDFLN